MEGFNVYKDIQDRTHGEIYIGVVGPVRTGKSTFIKKFMDTVVIPHIPDGIQRERAIDELPQSSAGRTIMTTEPKFIPEQAVDVQIDEDASFRVRMIDCVGYIVPSAIGYIEEDQPRMVRTPWYEEPIPFNMAAEIGTKKVITEHSTIGLVITTDGTISDIPREEYEEAEERVIDELNQTGRPYVMLLNCVEPERPEARELAARLGEKYSDPRAAGELHRHHRAGHPGHHCQSAVPVPRAGGGPGPARLGHLFGKRPLAAFRGAGVPARRLLHPQNVPGQTHAGTLARV